MLEASETPQTGAAKRHLGEARGSTLSSCGGRIGLSPGEVGSPWLRFYWRSTSEIPQRPLAFGSALHSSELQASLPESSRGIDVRGRVLDGLADIVPWLRAGAQLAAERRAGRARCLMTISVRQSEMPMTESVDRFSTNVRSSTSRPWWAENAVTESTTVTVVPAAAELLGDRLVVELPEV
jgi:hypothetical protein